MTIGGHPRGRNAHHPDSIPFTTATRCSPSDANSSRHTRGHRRSPASPPSGRASHLRYPNGIKHQQRSLVLCHCGRWGRDDKTEDASLEEGRFPAARSESSRKRAPRTELGEGRGVAQLPNVYRRSSSVRPRLYERLTVDLRGRCLRVVGGGRHGDEAASGSQAMAVCC